MFDSHRELYALLFLSVFYPYLRHISLSYHRKNRTQKFKGESPPMVSCPFKNKKKDSWNLHIEWPKYERKMYSSILFIETHI